MADRLKQKLCRKISLVSVKSTLYDMDCNEAKMKEGLLES